MNILIILNFATAIVALVVLVWKRHPFMALVALTCASLYGYGLWHWGLNVDAQICQTLLKEEGYELEKAYPSAIGGWTALMLSNVCLALYPWLKRWAVVLWLLLFLSVGFVVGMASPLGAVEGLYAVCCAIMSELAAIIGLTYLETTVLGNIYLQSLLPTVFAIPAFLVSVRGLIKRQGRRYLPVLLSGVWLALNLLMTIVVWRHYIHLSLGEACSKCVGELKELAGHTWSGYVMVNIIIFVVAFLIDFLVSWLLYRYAKIRQAFIIEKSSCHL